MVKKTLVIKTPRAKKTAKPKPPPRTRMTWWEEMFFFKPGDAASPEGYVQLRNVKRSKTFSPRRGQGPRTLSNSEDMLNGMFKHLLPRQRLDDRLYTWKEGKRYARTSTKVVKRRTRISRGGLFAMPVTLALGAKHKR